MNKGLHVMVDYETTGLNPYKNGVIEKGAVCFDLNSLEKTGHFNFPVALMSGRVWDNKTFDWHMSDPARKAHCEMLIEQGMNCPAKEVFMDFHEFIKSQRVKANCSEADLYFWCKPASFDWPFYQSHCEELGLTSPFHYRRVIDLQSFIRGIQFHHGSRCVNPMEYKRKHTALQDAHDQIDVLFDFLRRSNFK